MRQERDSGMRRTVHLAVKLADGAVSLTILGIFLAMMSYGCYMLWDARQIYAIADASVYTVYRPVPDDTESFAELQAINPEVFGWLTVYGTSIDYPLTQGEDNEKYVNTDAKGEYSLSGSIFLDSRNQQDFSDSVSILYGHDMVEKKMFGGLADFADEAYFQSHRYGNLFSGGQNYGVEFLVYLETDAYDTCVYAPDTADEELPDYVRRIYELAVRSRQAVVSENDHLILLSTCSAERTNGRCILVGRVTEETWPDLFSEGEEE